MTPYLSALVMGVLGGAHCLGMCGPLMIAVSCARCPKSGPVGGRGSGWEVAAHHAGRVGAYILLGLVFGLAGGAFSLAGMQRALSLFIGAAILAGLFAGSTRWGSAFLRRWTAPWQAAFARRLRRPGLRGALVLGGVHGFLPCGLVYVAALASAALGRPAASALFMALFGLGTVPLMAGLHGLGRQTPLRWRAALHRALPYVWVLMGLFFLLRGMNLGIPYLSPVLGADGSAAAVCH